MNYIIGIDAGGTKTETIAYDLNGHAIARTVKGFGNLLNGIDAALENIEDSVNEIISVLGIDDLTAIYVGAAGCEVSDNAKLIKERLNLYADGNIKVMNDAEIALKAMLKGRDGILAISGTGSIAFGINNGISARCGGWGNILGDEGSGYQISISAIKRMIKEEEEDLPQSLLTKAILNKLKIKSVYEITEFVYSSTKDEIASLTPIVARLGEDGEEASIEILMKQGIKLAKTVENLYRKLNFSRCSIGLVGGVIRNAKVVKDTFEKYLKENVEIEEFIYEEVSPTKGAYYEYIIENERGEVK